MKKLIVKLERKCRLLTWQELQDGWGMGTVPARREKKRKGKMKHDRAK